MKNYRFPVSASHSQLRFPKMSRARVALILALVAGLSCLPFYVFAQSDAPSVKSKRGAAYTEFTDGGVFVVYQGAHGDTICRDATIAETRALIEEVIAESSGEMKATAQRALSNLN